MPAKTIYVSKQDAPIFDEAKSLAGETLSSIIAQALRDFLAKHRQKESGLKEISVRIGRSKSEQEQRFFGNKIGEWRGFSDNQEWWMQAQIYRTQKDNWAVFLTQVCKASLLTDKKRWKLSGDYLLDSRHSDLLVASEPNELQGKIPADLFRLVQELATQTNQPVTLLDI